MPQPKKAEWEERFDDLFTIKSEEYDFPVVAFDDEEEGVVLWNAYKIKNFIRSTLEAERARIVGVLGGLRKEAGDIKDESFRFIAARHYNCALTDAIKSIEE